MTLDKEQDRAILLQLIDTASIPGKVVQEVADLKARIKAAQIATEAGQGAE